jgi:predicted lipid-binding transport protein (Tim44 family)
MGASHAHVDLQRSCGKMNGTFDILTLLFLVIAVVIFLRLRSVLGRRTGNERPRYDPYSAPDANGKTVRDNIVTLPRGEPARAPEEALDEATFARRLKDIAPADSDVGQKLSALAQVDRDFDPRHFMQGARGAYEMTVTAFAHGDRKALKQLLSRDVYDSFNAAIDEREKAGESVDFNFVGISKAEITDAEILGKAAHITVKFVSELITATRNKAGEVIDGDASHIREVTDIWTFARETTARDPNWRLVATGSA